MLVQSRGVCSDLTVLVENCYFVGSETGMKMAGTRDCRVRNCRVVVSIAMGLWRYRRGAGALRNSSASPSVDEYWKSEGCLHSKLLREFWGFAVSIVVASFGCS